MSQLPAKVLALGLDSVPAYAGFIGTEIGLLLAASAVFSLITPYDEVALIKDGNKGAAIAFGGTILALAIVINSVGVQTHGLFDLAVWTLIGLIIQLIAFFAMRLVFSDIFQKIAADRSTAHGSVVAAVSVGVALLNQAALTA